MLCFLLKFHTNYVANCMDGMIGIVSEIYSLMTYCPKISRFFILHLSLIGALRVTSIEFCYSVLFGEEK